MREAASFDGTSEASRGRGFEARESGVKNGFGVPERGRAGSGGDANSASRMADSAARADSEI